MTLGNFQKQLLLLLTEAETARYDFYQELWNLFSVVLSLIAKQSFYIYIYNYHIYDSCQGSTFVRVTVGKIAFLSATELWDMSRNVGN